MTIKVGDKMPSGTLTLITKDGPQKVTADEYFSGKKVVLFSVPGAFTPTCDAKHLPGFVEQAANLKGKGVAKILGDPRQPSFAIEWMTTHLVEDFQTKNGSALHCKSCHRGNVGTPQFERKIILTNHLPSD